MRVVLTAALATFVVLLLFVFATFRDDVARARLRVLADSQIIPTARGPVEAAIVGGGPPVLVLHGAGGGWDQGLMATEALLPQGFTVIAPSRFGYLRTPLPPDSSVEAEADTWAALLDALHIERAPVIAFSAGTSPAMQLALRHPDRVSALVLVVPAGGGIWPDVVEGPSGALLDATFRFDFPLWAVSKVAPSLMHRLIGMPPALVRSLPSDQRARVDAIVDALLPFSARRLGVLNEGRTQGSGRLYPIERIAAPTLLLSAPDDLYNTLRVARLAVKQIPNARLLEFEQGGHLLIGNDDRIWPVVVPFLREAAGTSVLAEEPAA